MELNNIKPASGAKHSKKRVGRGIGSGTGKTALARALAKCLAGGEQHLSVLDMGEFHDSFTLARLVGSPPGYVGYREESLLARAANRHPFGVLLLERLFE